MLPFDVLHIDADLRDAAHVMLRIMRCDAAQHSCAS
jgi:hypothetical protein